MSHGLSNHAFLTKLFPVFSHVIAALIWRAYFHLMFLLHLAF